LKFKTKIPHQIKFSEIFDKDAVISEMETYYEIETPKEFDQLVNAAKGYLLRRGIQN